MGNGRGLSVASSESYPNEKREEGLRAEFLTFNLEIRSNGLSVNR